MSKYLIHNNTLTGIADEVRQISGTTGILVPGDMKNKLASANSKLDEQTELITQISAALEGKAIGGGSGGAGAEFPYNVTVNGAYNNKWYFTFIDDLVFICIGLDANGRMPLITWNSSAYAYTTATNPTSTGKIVILQSVSKDIVIDVTYPSGGGYEGM